jgi:hypothetical protein
MEGRETKRRTGDLSFERRSGRKDRRDRRKGPNIALKTWSFPVHQLVK